MITKSLAVLGNDGAGKKTLIGSLIHKCGLELRRVEELQRAGVRDYADIVPFYENKGYEQTFYAPSGPFHVGESHTAKTIMWVADANDSSSWGPSAQALAKALSNGSLPQREILIILLNKMDLTSWSKSVFSAAVDIFSAAVRTENESYMIPISSLKGDNLLSTPQEQEQAWVSTTSSGHLEDASLASAKPLMELLKA